MSVIYNLLGLSHCSVWDVISVHNLFFSSATTDIVFRLYITRVHPGKACRQSRP